ncbi:serine carboxypeptidase-like 25 [Actinidia rufa]|uniref:Carboxypeptidase n=1 Tax=Actinidia rufa TaxID=165716 RepID=A0A7J0EEF9_9ERIC|nr:serine carboxypeptidase-like 25 [Actinidia rufa]
MAKGQVFVSMALALLVFMHVGGIRGEMRGGGGGEEGDRILALPGQPKVSFQQFSGYVSVNKVPQDYTSTSSRGTPRQTYCSSKLRPGLAFSYTNRSSDLFDTGDRRTAKDSLQFLIQWMDRFPRYKTREVYLTGESYAGHYVPQLAKEIVTYNANSKHPIKLKGFMVGNAVTDNYYDNLGTVTYWWSHAMISDRTYRQLINICDFSQLKESNECESLYSYAMDQEFGNIDQYNIYAPPCNNSDGRTNGCTRHTIRLPHRPHPIFRQMSGYDPCTEKYAEIYYNRPDVQKAMHANTTKIPYKWTACNEVLNRNWNDTDVSILPIYRDLIAAGLRIWVFSGDVDSVVPVTATRYSLAQLKLSTKIPWYPWYVKKQVGGWTEVYEGLTFATVRGAGHEVPLFKPRATLQLFRSFLSGQPLPTKS